MLVLVLLVLVCVGVCVGGVCDVSVVGFNANYVIDVTEIAEIVRKIKF